MAHSLRTRVVSAGRPAAVPGAPLTTPVVLSSTFHAGAEPAYARDGNPTWSAFEDALGDLEGGAALAFASGAAAIAAVLETVPQGATVVAPEVAYAGTVSLVEDLARRGRFQLRQVAVGDTRQVVAAVPGAHLVWLESATNPLTDVCDIPAVSAAARASGARVVVDATFATPVVSRPLELGADLVVHSVTKYLSGHSDLLLGATVTRDTSWYDELVALRHDRGGIPGPFETWLALRGLRTLALRMERAQSNAADLAARLAEHPAVVRVRHPSRPEHPGRAVAERDWSGYGAIVSVEVHGGADGAERVAAATRLWAHATSLGGVESTLERRRRWPNEPRGVPESLLRLSVGIEDVEDLWTDLAAALDLAAPQG